MTDDELSELSKALHEAVIAVQSEVRVSMSWGEVDMRGTVIAVTLAVNMRATPLETQCQIQLAATRVLAASHRSIVWTLCLVPTPTLMMGVV